MISDVSVFSGLFHRRISGYGGVFAFQARDVHNTVFFDGNGKQERKLLNCFLNPLYFLKKGKYIAGNRRSVFAL
ncbi:MAG TPA: hypothetical protein DER70_18445 [Lentisphaeria bacterium]|nr:hypothetical protein [Lentisphaeria bacterium]